MLFRWILDLGPDILQYILNLCVDLYIWEIREKYLANIRQNCIVTQECFDSPYSFSIRVPQIVLDRIFNSQNPVEHSLLAINEYPRHEVIWDYLRGYWMRIVQAYESDHPKLIELNSWSIVLDGVAFQGLPIQDEAYVIVESLHYDFESGLGIFSYNPRVLL
jgi:hypothetical protein